MITINHMYKSLYTFFRKMDRWDQIQFGPCTAGILFRTYSRVVALSLLLLFASTSVFLSTPVRAETNEKRHSQESSVSQVDSPQVEATNANRALELYGMEYINDISDHSVVEALGVDTIVIEFSAYESEDQWIAKLDEAADEGLQVVANYWPEGWSWNEDENRWDITQGARSFLQAVGDYPTLLAIYGLHEPYWQGCEGCGYTTLQQQKLYRQIKSIVDVPIWSVFSSFQWADQTYGGSDYEFADDVCDYCATWKYPSLSSRYIRKAMIAKLESELDYFRDRTPSAKFIWVLQAFESVEDSTEMPTYKEMLDMAAVAMQYDIDGVTWYAWDFDQNEYPETLSRNSDLWSAVRDVRVGCFDDPNSSACIDLSMRKGDINCDNQINATDALGVLQFAVGARSEIGACHQNAFRTASNSIIGDVNDSGRVDSVDAMMLLQCEAGMSNQFCGDRD